MIAALPVLTLALLGQADPFTLRFDGFVETQEMKTEPLTAMFHGAFEAVSDANDSQFGVVDQGPVDVIVSAAQQLDDQGLVFRWFLSTVRCPGRAYDFVQHRPKKALDIQTAEKMVREVAKNADLLRRERIGRESAACAEDGESLGGTATSAPDGTLGLAPAPSATMVGMSGGFVVGQQRLRAGTFQPPPMAPAKGFGGGAVRGTEPTNAVRGTEPTNAVRGTEPTLYSPLAPHPTSTNAAPPPATGTTTAKKKK